MEQIGVISEFRLKSSEMEVRFPQYSWLQNEIYYYAVPRIRKGNKEILLSLIDPKEWHRAWEIMFNIEVDRPGIVFDLTKLLASKAINIIKQEGLTPSEELQYSFWALVKLTDYAEREKLNGKTQHEISEYLRDDLNRSLSEKGISGITISAVKEIELLYENFHSAVSPELNSIPPTKLVGFFQTRIGFWISNFRCKIPVDRLFNVLGLSVEGQKSVHGTIFSDFSQKNFFIIRVFEPSQKVIFFDIRHKHVVGAIKELSEIIFNESAKKFNILYNRVTIKKDPGEYTTGIENASHWYVLMEIQDNVEKINDVFKYLESHTRLTFGEGKTIRILDYTENLRTVLHPQYRKKISDAPVPSSRLRLLVLSMTSLAIILGSLIYLFNIKAISTYIQESPLGGAILILMTIIIGIKEFKDSIVEFFSTFKN